MRVYVQWAKADPDDYVSLELTRIQHVRSLPRKGLPTPGATLDGNPGWLADVVVQGVSFASWDHLSAAFPASGGLQVLAWNDDPEDYPAGPHGQVWTFLDPAPDPRYGGRINTRQTLTIYSDDPAYIAFWTGDSTSSGPVAVRPWSDFPMPAANVTLHGIWQTDESWARHRAAAASHGWREWVVT